MLEHKPFDTLMEFVDQCGAGLDVKTRRFLVEQAIAERNYLLAQKDRESALTKREQQLSKTRRKCFFWSATVTLLVCAIFYGYAINHSNRRMDAEQALSQRPAIIIPDFAAQEDLAREKLHCATAQEITNAHLIMHENCWFTDFYHPHGAGKLSQYTCNPVGAKHMPKP